MATNQRLLLVEQLDSVGASLADLRPHAQVLRRSGFDVRMVAIATDGDDDLQYGTAERAQPGIERLAEHDAADGVRRAAEDCRADAIVWASATPGGGETARSLASRWPAWWWPTGWSSARPDSRLASLTGSAEPGDACVVEGVPPRIGRLSLWDGPYALVASPPRAEDAATLFEGFAKATDSRDDVDLVILDHLDADLEGAARAAGMLQRVHFVGSATLEAEGAWLQHARAAFMALHRPLSAGLVLRALAAGCPVLPVGSAADPLAEWLKRHGVSWTRPGAAGPAWDSLAAALERKPAVETAIARGRARATDANVDLLASSFATTLANLGGKRARAA